MTGWLISHSLFGMMSLDQFSSQLVASVRHPEDSGILFDVKVSWAIWNCGSLWGERPENYMILGFRPLETWKEGPWLEQRKCLLENPWYTTNIQMLPLSVSMTLKWGKKCFPLPFPLPSLPPTPALHLTCWSQPSHLHCNPIMLWVKEVLGTYLRTQTPSNNLVSQGKFL